VYAIATVNQQGQKVRKEVLSATSGNTTFAVQGTRAATDASGKLALVRAGTAEVTTATGSTAQRPVIGVSVYDPVSGTWPYSTLMTGDALKPGGPYGYELTTGPFLTSGALSFTARCYGNCSNTQTKLYTASVPGLGMDYPQSDIVQEVPPVPYAALEDSFSAGEGVGSYETGTTIPGTNECDRSTRAYPILISGVSGVPSLNMDGFRACSGARTEHLATTSQWNEGVQLNRYVNKTTTLVTLTIGGNDIRFGDFATDCVTSTCEIGGTSYNTIVGKITNELPEKLKATYRAILDYAPNAEVHVIGYPQVVADKASNDPFDSRCFYLYDSNNASDHWQDARGARDVIAKLNQAIDTAVGNVRGEKPDNLRLRFVNVNAVGSPFEGHGVCSSEGDSYFLNLDQLGNNKNYVFHPNEEGQQAYAQIVLDSVS
jgi:lysophospholipase L1-like esterase